MHNDSNFNYTERVNCCVHYVVPITVELGVYINYIYAFSEQTMVSQTLFTYMIYICKCVN